MVRGRFVDYPWELDPVNTPARRPALRFALSALALVGVLLVAPPPTAAQESTDSLRVELARLAAVVDSLRAEVARLQQAGQEEEAQDALAQLRAAAQAAAAAGGPPPAEQPAEQEFQGRQRSLQALNPEISVNADMFGQVIKGDTDAENFFAREVEISIISNLDPYSRAKFFISRHLPGAELVPFGAGGDAHAHEDDSGFAVEEGYVEWVGLPGGVNVKFGRFFQRFGQLNRWHRHALPFQTQSLPHLAFLGEEALAQTGVSAHWLIPIGGGAGTYEATVEVTTSEHEGLFGESGRPSILTHLNGFWQLSRATDVDVGVSWINGRHETEDAFFDRNLYQADMAFTWRPPGRARYRGVQVRAGAMLMDGLGIDDEVVADHAWGVWSMAEVRFSARWLMGARMDWTENPRNPEESAWLFAPTLTWWQSEYVRIRAEYDLLDRSFETAQEGRFVIQVTFAVGPHKHETY